MCDFNGTIGPSNSGFCPAPHGHLGAACDCSSCQDPTMCGPPAPTPPPPPPTCCGGLSPSICNFDGVIGPANSGFCPGPHGHAGAACDCSTCDDPSMCHAPTPPAPTPGPSGNVTFEYTGATQLFTVPAGATALQITAYGAAGGPANNGYAAAKGGASTGILTPVRPGQTLYVEVGGSGGAPTTFAGGKGGYNGGGNGAAAMGGSGGGGASDVRTKNGDLTTRVIVAGGGGGAQNNGFTGGDGGGVDGGHACPALAPVGPTGGSGGSQTGGGDAGTPTGGALGLGGSGVATFAAGGGGGYYGGGAARGSPGTTGRDCASGGGGSGYVVGLATPFTTAGANVGNGRIVIEPVP